MRVLIAGLLLLTIMTTALAGSPTTDVPWDRVPGASDFTPFQRRAAETVLRTSYCYGGCKDRLIDCLNRNDAIAVRLAGFLSRQVITNPNANRILKLMEKRRLSAVPNDTVKVDLAGLLPSGNPNAPIEVVLYGDFDCPYCKTAATALRELSLAYPDSFSFWFKNYPLSQDERALPAAIAYLAAEREGRGWEMFDGLFNHSWLFNDTALEQVADASGVDLAQYRADIKDPALEDRVRKERAEANACGFTTVPGIVVNGKPYHGLLSKVELWDRIQEERELMARQSKLRAAQR